MSTNPMTSVDLDLDLDLAPAALAQPPATLVVGRRPCAPVDFQRPVHALLGLPMDAIDMAHAVEAVRGAAFSDTPCMVSTPNLNFVVAALSDAAFRETVTCGDLNLVDGMPLVWVARLLGVPVRERVSGAGLFEALAAHPGPPLDVFFFGGPDGVARAACERLNATARGLRCVGFASPGFGSVEQMSGDAYLSRINACAPHFVIAALGAHKGQTWLQRNRERIAAPVRCHLGAVINFAAGRVRRAPRALQRVGLEWLWRIAQEPSLWRRYLGDGLRFLGLLVTSVLPLLIERAARRGPGPAPAVLSEERGGDACTLTLGGAWTAHALAPLREALARAQADGVARMRLVLREVTCVDSAFVGLLMIAPRAFAQGLECVDVPRPLARTLQRHRAGWLLAPAR